MQSLAFVRFSMHVALWIYSLYQTWFFFCDPISLRWSLWWFLWFDQYLGSPWSPPVSGGLWWSHWSHIPGRLHSLRHQRVVGTPRCGWRPWRHPDTGGDYWDFRYWWRAWSLSGMRPERPPIPSIQRSSSVSAETVGDHWILVDAQRPHCPDSGGAHREQSPNGPIAWGEEHLDHLFSYVTIQERCRVIPRLEVLARGTSCERLMHWMGCVHGYVVSCRISLQVCWAVHTWISIAYLCTCEQAKNQFFVNIRARISLNYSSDTRCLVDPLPFTIVHMCMSKMFCLWYCSSQTSQGFSTECWIERRVLQCG